MVWGLFVGCSGCFDFFPLTKSPKQHLALLNAGFDQVIALNLAQEWYLSIPPNVGVGESDRFG
jgi:hypothetical protein